MDLNLTSAFLCTKLIGKAMIEREQGGRVINICSINSLVAGRGIDGRHYETAKGALLQFTRTTAVDWAATSHHGQRDLAGRVHDGAKPALVEVASGGDRDVQRADIPLGDFGQPEDLGPLAVYLASDASRYMTGAAL